MKYIIETESITKRYGDKNAVDKVSIHVPEGKIYGLLGRNGAGKTTLMKMLLNLIHNDGGRIYLLGKEQGKDLASVYGNVGSIIETPGFYENLTGSENLRIIAMLRGIKGTESVDKALAFVGLDKEVKKVFGDYSLGMKQRLGIAAAVMHNPKVLILDEPINGLDPIGIQEIRKFLLELARDKGTTILISSHVLSEIEQISDIIGVMHQGRLVEEINLSDLRQSLERYVDFTLSDTEKGSLLLKGRIPEEDFAIRENNVLRIRNHINGRGEINKLFVEGGLQVTDIKVEEESLEDYFKDLIGGGTIG